MREILFRGKRVDNDEWFEGVDVMHNTILGELCLSNANQNWVCIVPSTMSQYTGATDKYDKKIFEGDVVKYDNQLYTIRYIEQYCRFGGVKPHTVCAVFNFKNSVIVGNIHDNPELLEGVKING